MIINHNINAISTNRVYAENVKSIGGSTETLSSGLRINRAQDDAAGLAVSEKLRTQSRGLAQGTRNASDAISFLQTTEGHLNELTNVLQRIRVLSIQSANGTYSEEDRSAIQIEVDQLTDEIARVADQADFAKLKLLTDASAEANVDALTSTPWALRLHVNLTPTEDMAVYLHPAHPGQLLVDKASDGEVSSAPTKLVNVTTALDALTAVVTIDLLVTEINHQRSHLGAFSNRLESAIRSSDYAVENLVNTEARDYTGESLVDLRTPR